MLTIYKNSSPNLKSLDDSINTGFEVAYYKAHMLSIAIATVGKYSNKIYFVNAKREA